ncbi:hypothetical protein GCM10009630_10770 [Kribbella jejuensis]
MLAGDLLEVFVVDAAATEATGEGARERHSGGYRLVEQFLAASATGGVGGSEEAFQYDGFVSARPGVCDWAT